MPRLSKIGAAALAAFGWTTGGASVTATYLVVAGGGGGGKRVGAGGGAGGYRTGTLSLNPSLSYTVTVGAGGAGSGVYSSIGTNGSDSTFSTVTSTGGGGGDSSNPSKGGGSGGSGGGSSDGGTAGSGNTPSTSPSQGNNGGVGSGSSPNYGAGGGGGAGATGGNGSSTVAGNGGAGTANSISGSSVTYAGGGGGGSYGGTAGSGGSGGGGAGSNADATATSGTANTGGGGGGCGGISTSSGTTFGGAGGSGIVIISYPGPQQFSGGVVTLSGGNVIHTFTTSGTLGPITTLSASYLIVAGGGGGGYDVGGGGGAGGLLTGSGIVIDPNSTYLVTVGAGGAGAASSVNGTNGSSSAFSMVTTTAVGGGGGASASNTAGSSGGSGGGGTRISAAGGSGTSGQGSSGGSGSPSSGANVSAAGGGGGAGAVGANATNGVGGAGGIGVASSISGTSTYYAGGGGGRCDGSGTQGTGGSGGGGTAGSTGTAGTANTGGGGGGGSTGGGGTGGSGVVIISYPGSTQQMAGGTVTISGGNVIHTFTSTGYLAPIKLVGNSLRFRASASAYLSRTPTTTGNRKTWTWSAWVKRAQTGSTNILFTAASDTSNSNLYELRYISDGGASGIVESLQLSGPVGYAKGSAQYRDPAAWYHVVCATDTTQAVQADRCKIYVNGLPMAMASNNLYSLNEDTSFNTTGYPCRMGNRISSSTLNFDGNMTEINFVDGQALPPTAFGTFNSYGVWQPITYGGSYGTNGFYLPFTANASSYAGFFNSGSQYLETTATQIIPATGDFTIEAMTYMTSFANYPEIAVQGTAGNAGRTQFGINASGQLFIGAGAGGGNATGISMALNRWYYVAVTRSGSTFNCYVNGILAGTITASVTVQNTTLRVGIDWGGDYTNGYISNLRISNVVRTISPSTAPTSNFSNDASTVFLTLQGSTIVDNSSNAYAITNNGTVTVGKTYPFAYTVFNDQSPQGNNWTPNNVSGAFGTTLDYMTDVPTLTSATAANYCVLNPLDADTSSLGISLTNGNLTASGTTYAVSVYTCTFRIPQTGKWYYEFVYSSLTSTAAVGIRSYSTSSTDIQYLSNGNKTVAGTTTAYGSTWTTGDTMGVAVDRDAGTITFYKNNTSQGAITIPTNSAAFDMAWNSLAPYGTASVSVNFGQQPWKYTPPSGFIAINAFNM